MRRFLDWILVVAIGLTFLYPPVELTRYILAWQDVYGSLPPGESLLPWGFQGEILLIWLGYAIGIFLTRLVI